MLVPTIIKGMSRGGASALKRTRQIASHMMSTTAEVCCSCRSSRPEDNFIISRIPLNSSLYPSCGRIHLIGLKSSMLSMSKCWVCYDPKSRWIPCSSILRFHSPLYLKSWRKSELCGVILGRGTGRAFCAGGDVASELNLFIPVSLDLNEDLATRCCAERGKS